MNGILKVGPAIVPLFQMYATKRGCQTLMIFLCLLLRRVLTLIVRHKDQQARQYHTPAIDTVGEGSD